MNCEQFQSELDQAIDERTSSTEFATVTSAKADLLSHAESCEHCQQTWQDFLLLESALTSWNDPVEVDLVDRVIGAAKTEFSDSAASASQSQAVREIRSTRFSWSAVIAVAVVLVGVAIAFRSGPDEIANGDPDQNSLPVPEPDGPFEPDENEQYAGVDELLASTRTAWDGIRQRASSRASDFSVFVPNFRSDLGLTNADSEPDEPEPEETTDEPSIVPEGIDRAFDFLLDVSSDVTTT